MIRARMHRALTEDAQPRFVNVAQWESRQALDAASATPEFRASTQRMRDDPGLHINSHPTVYELAVEVAPQPTS
jgi:heme-degrading monooxygenase HmoA